MNYKSNCRYFQGDRPCQYQQDCSYCQEYSPIGKKILIIKLGSPGDVLRTTAILRGIKKRFKDAYIYWVTQKESIEILENNHLIDELYPLNYETQLILSRQRFDLILSLDKDKAGCALAEVLDADEKKGFGLNGDGCIYPLNKGTEYSFKLGLLNRLKFKENRKTYQELIFEMADLCFKDEEYILNLDKQQKDFKRDFLRKNRLKERDSIVGLNTGSGKLWPHKKWRVDGFSSLINRLSQHKNIRVVLLGGPDEEETNKQIISQTKIKAKTFLFDSGYNNGLKDFIALVDCCDLVVSGDTMAMHIAIALKKKVVALFGPTCPQEIYLYNRGIKIVSVAKCAPCYKNLCSKNSDCMSLIKPAKVDIAIRKLISKPI